MNKFAISAETYSHFNVSVKKVSKHKSNNILNRLYILIGLTRICSWDMHTHTHLWFYDSHELNDKVLLSILMQNIVTLLGNN